MCEKGYIKRSAYTRKDGAYIPSKCIKDRGLPGKGPKILPTLKKGKLSQFGYSSDLSAPLRHKALTKSVKKTGYVSTIARLNAISILLKNTSPKKAKIFRDDIKWIQNNLQKYQNKEIKIGDKKLKIQQGPKGGKYVVYKNTNGNMTKRYITK